MTDKVKLNIQKEDDLFPEIPALEEKREIYELLEIACQKDASDLHLNVDYPPILRIYGNLLPLEDRPVLTPGYLEKLIYMILTEDQKKTLEKEKEIDFSLSFREKAHFRVNIFYQKGTLAASFRLIPAKIRTIEELNLPPVLHEFTKPKSGLFLVTGPTGHGKSSTLAALLDEINKNQAVHILTIEDPIEYVFEPQKALITQRELNTDTNSFSRALRAALREDPDVILVGEMRDLETMQAALTVAETGHLVYSTVHAEDVLSVPDRIISAFPANEQAQVRIILSSVLLGVLSQRLIPKKGGGRVPVVELLIATPAVRSLIREGKTYQLPSALQTGVNEGMITIERSLKDLLNRGLITEEIVKEVGEKL